MLVPFVVASLVATKGFPGLTSPTSSVAPHAGTAFVYAGYAQMPGADNIGASARMLQGDPRLATGDAHTLAELAVQSQDLQQIVEIGWHVDALVNGDYWPRLFVFHWVNGVPTCYSRRTGNAAATCGWVQVSPTHYPGMRVQPGAEADYMIKREGTDWWIYYQGEAMGYFPGSEWTSEGVSFTSAFTVQWFGEIAATQANSCSEMGNGVFGTSASAARMSNLQVIPSGGTPVAATAYTGTVSNAALWSVGQTTPTSFAFGGPGTGACCVPETCAEAQNECNSFQDQCGTTRNCGPCDNGVACTADRTCGDQSQLPPDGGVTGDDAGVGPSPDAGGGNNGGDDDGDGGGEGGGCCGAAGPAALLPAFIVAPLIRRRRRRAG